MKKLLMVVLLVILMFTVMACGVSTPMNAEGVVNSLKMTKLPINTIIVFTEETDLNKLLGKPHQYVSKVNFSDARLNQVAGSDPNGGSIEIFNSKEDLTARKEYLESVYLKMPALKNYLFVNKKYLLRLSNDLTGSQMKEYEEKFMKIK